MIKFRVFSDGKYFYSENSEGLSFSYFVDMYEGIIDRWEQYTGRKDKNGIDIYMRDIVHNEWLVDDSRGDIGDDYEVVFGSHVSDSEDYYAGQYGGYGYYLKQFPDSNREMAIDSCPGHLIVIGNIQEGVKDEQTNQRFIKNQSN